jgi:hypothetical protein
MLSWGKVHPLKATVVAAAAVIGVAALIAYVLQRRPSPESDVSSEDADDTGFEVEDLVTSQEASPPIPESDRGQPFADKIAPTRERRTQSHHFRPIRLP